MKRIFPLLLLFSAAILLSATTKQSKQRIFLRMIDASGKAIRGSVVERFYEGQIDVASFSGYTTGNSQITFKMASDATTAVLANLQGSKQALSSAVFTITQPSYPRSIVTLAVRMEEITVMSVSDANGITEVVLNSSRIGVTYFQNNLKSGVQTVSSKTGYDFVNKQPWTAF